MNKVVTAITIASLSGAMVLIAAGPSTFRVVYNLAGGYDQPGGIIEGEPGVFFSIAGGGPSIVFSVSSQGVQTVLGTIPKGPLFTSLVVSGANDRYYTTFEDSTYPGHVLSIASAPNLQKTYPAQHIIVGLTQNLPDGRMLGTGIALPGGSGVAICDLDGAVSILSYLPSPFNDTVDNVISASDGNYYGVAQADEGPTGYIFRVTPSGNLTTLYTFPSGTFNIAHPTPLLQGDDGNLYGSTTSGGANGTGMIYRLTLSGQFTLLHSFDKSSGGIPHGPVSLVEASDGNLYGVAQNDNLLGLIFRCTKSGEYDVLYQMSIPDGTPPGWLIQGSDGIFYGIAHAGGGTGEGTVFAFDAGLRKPIPSARQFEPNSGAAGAVVRIWGYNLLSASVTFNGVPAAKVSNSGSNYVWATVPAGAISGPITVTTPGGVSTTSDSFTVQ
jgi:uncharacterized repeat protein (TIGR03803 family)